MDKKIIQIISSKTDGVDFYALCDDGTIWTCVNSGISTGNWKQLESLPDQPAFSDSFYL